MKSLVFIIVSSLSVGLFGQSIPEIISHVNENTLETMLKELTGEVSTVVNGNSVTILNRESNQNDLAKDFIVERLSNLNNITVTTDAYSTNGTNIIATQAGTSNPNNVVVICAHYDSVANYCADDNATGTIAVLEVARILSAYCFDYTIQYVLFDEEEDGLEGSQHFVNTFDSAHNLIGAINLDMMGYDRGQANDAPIHVQDSGNSYALKDSAVSVLNTYNAEIELTPNVIDPGIEASDHFYFWFGGRTAIMISDASSFEDLTPHYHTADDRVSTLDLPYYYNMVRFLLAITASTAEVSATQDCSNLSNPTNKANQGVQIFPNPVGEYVIITLPNNRSSEASVGFYNILGELIYQQELTEIKTQIDLARFYNGVYFVKVKNDKETITKKLIVD